MGTGDVPGHPPRLTPPSPAFNSQAGRHCELWGRNKETAAGEGRRGEGSGGVLRSRAAGSSNLRLRETWESGEVPVSRKWPERGRGSRGRWGEALKRGWGWRKGNRNSAFCLIPTGVWPRKGRRNEARHSTGRRAGGRSLGAGGAGAGGCSGQSCPFSDGPEPVNTAQEPESLPAIRPTCFKATRHVETCKH